MVWVAANAPPAWSLLQLRNYDTHPHAGHGHSRALSIGGAIGWDSISIDSRHCPDTLAADAILRTVFRPFPTSEAP
jgi:hypothetical protein